MAPDVSTRECARLARVMTLKNAVSGLPHGGGKSVLFGDPKMHIEEKERLIRGMACPMCAGCSGLAALHQIYDILSEKSVFVNAAGCMTLLAVYPFTPFTGRLKEMIIRGGENIYPREIEDALFAHPKIADVVVFGVPDDYYGEEVMAWIQLRVGEESDEQEIRHFLKGNVAHFKIPRYIWFVDEFPMTVTGKLQKFRMREMALERLGHGAGQDA